MQEMKEQAAEGCYQKGCEGLQNFHRNKCSYPIDFVFPDSRRGTLRIRCTAVITVLGRTILSAGFFQVVFVASIVNSHLTMIYFEDAIDETA
jgi:hypothetical protein